MATLETEIRKLQPAELCTLAQYLDESNYWKKLMAIVPKENDPTTFFFNHDHFRMIEQAIHQQKRSGAEIFLSEWSTLNRNRPTCKLLLELLLKIQYFKAADYLAVDVLKIDPPERPKQGPGAHIDISDKMLEKQLMGMAALNVNSDNGMSYSVHFAEKPAELIPVQAEKEAPQISYPNMIEFSVTTSASNLIEFSKTDDDMKQLPEQVASTKVDDDDGEFDFSAYGLQVVDSAYIPICVNASEDLSEDQDNDNLTTATQSTISASSIVDSNLSLPTASDSDIPIAVLMYNKNDT